VLRVASGGHQWGHNRAVRATGNRQLATGNRQLATGYTLPELLVALLILGIVITTTLAMFAKRSQYLRESSETILVWQAMWNEMEIWRRIDWNSLESQPPKFRSDLGLLDPLGNVDTKVTVEVSKDDPHVKNVTLTVFFEYDKEKKIFRRDARLSLLRADTGGSNLW
jgi:prepilin-type N-terminal cleavage/methylation domain-containing protein